MVRTQKRDLGPQPIIMGLCRNKKLNRTWVWMKCFLGQKSGFYKG